MKVTVIDGNILYATENIIGHQVNCQGVMGSGLAKTLRGRYSNLYPMYAEYCENHNPHELLGKCHIIKTGSKYIANLFGQLNYGRQKVRYTDYVALQKALLKLKHHAKEKNLTVALPYNIGCGLANGDWYVVYEIIEKTFDDIGVTLYRM